MRFFLCGARAAPPRKKARKADGYAAKANKLVSEFAEIKSLLFNLQPVRLASTQGSIPQAEAPTTPEWDRDALFTRASCSQFYEDRPRQGKVEASTKASEDGSQHVESLGQAQKLPRPCDSRALASMQNASKHGLDRMPAVEPTIASLIVAPEEVLRPNARCPRPQCRINDDLLIKCYDTGARMGRIRNSLSHLILAMSQSLQSSSADTSVQSLSDTSLQAFAYMTRVLGRARPAPKAQRGQGVGVSPPPGPQEDVGAGADGSGPGVGRFTQQHLICWGSCTTDPWMVATFSQWYNLQFRCRPPVFRGIRLTTVSDPTRRQALSQEVTTLLEKKAIEIVDPQTQQGMRILVNLLLDTLPMLGNVLLLCFFVFFIFGIIGVQLWAGLLRNRCYLEENFTL
ncbi:unnamed protein product [Boreogadus saida]